MSIIATAFFSTLASATFAYIIRQMSLKFSIGIDERHGVPRVGGLAIILTVTLVSLLLLKLEQVQLVALFGAAIVASVGLLDDLGYGLGAIVKLAVSIAVAAGTIYVTDIYISHINTPILSNIFEFTPLAIVVSVIALAGMCHGINLIDGLHGLALSFAVIAFGAHSVIAYKVGDTKTVALTITMACACIGLIVFNFPSGSIFLGDVGSYFIGFTAAWSAIYLCHQHENVSPWAIVCIFAYPVVDVAYAASRRLLNGQNPMMGDKEHLHHRLLKLTDSRRRNNPRHAVMIVTLSCSAIALVPATLAAINFSEPQTLMALAATTITFLAVVHWIASLTS